MDKKQLKKLLVSNFKPVAGVDFADTTSATRNALIEYYGLKDLSSREVRANKAYIMTLIEEVIDEILPEKLQERVGQFADVRTYARDEEVVFEIKGRGKRRAYLTIQKGSRGGMYRAARLDSTHMTLATWTETVGVYVTLEEILLGKYTLQELMNNILDGFVERLYVQVIEALQTASASTTYANRASADGIVKSDFDGLLRIVSSYGSPVIMGFKSSLSKLNNIAGFVPSDGTPNVPTEDLTDIRNQGFVGTYGGYPVIELQNYITNELTNDEWLLDEGYIFILPANSKPVKVALRGDLRIREIEHKTGSMEQNGEKMLGVGMLLANNVAVYQDTEVA